MQVRNLCGVYAHFYGLLDVERKEMAVSEAKGTTSWAVLRGVIQHYIAQKKIRICGTADEQTAMAAACAIRVLRNAIWYMASGTTPDYYIDCDLRALTYRRVSAEDYELFDLSSVVQTVLDSRRLLVLNHFYNQMAAPEKAQSDVGVYTDMPFVRVDRHWLIDNAYIFNNLITASGIDCLMKWDFE